MFRLNLLQQPELVSAHHKQASSALYWLLLDGYCCSPACTKFSKLWLLQDVFTLCLHYRTSIPDSGGSALSGVPWYHPVQGRTVAWAAHTPGTASSRASCALPTCMPSPCLLQLCMALSQVAVKRLCTSGAPPAVEEAFLKEIQVLQLASGVCQRTCRMLGCCKLDGDPCIVMSLYPKSAAKLLQDHAGQLYAPFVL